MATKKVIGFLDAVDDIPFKSVWLHSRKLDFSKEKITNEDEPQIKRAESGEYAQYIHYYEVDGDDVDQLKTEGFFKMSIMERIKKFHKEHKLQTA